MHSPKLRLIRVGIEPCAWEFERRTKPDAKLKDLGVKAPRGVEIGCADAVVSGFDDGHGVYLGY